jgi:DNA-binding NtrC family response regulator
VSESEKRILVLDDEPIVVERLSEALKREGLTVEGFTAGAAALQALRERPFHVVVTDLKMRPPTGMDLVREVRRSFPETRLLVITGYADRETWESLRKAGVAEIVAKPFRLREVVERVKAL